MMDICKNATLFGFASRRRHLISLVATSLFYQLDCLTPAFCFRQDFFTISKCCAGLFAQLLYINSSVLHIRNSPQFVMYHTQIPARAQRFTTIFLASRCLTNVYRTTMTPGVTRNNLFKTQEEAGGMRRFAPYPPPDEYCSDLKSFFRNEFWRSEEHTSELQSPDHLVCRLLLEKKKKKKKTTNTIQ